MQRAKQWKLSTQTCPRMSKFAHGRVLVSQNGAESYRGQSLWSVVLVRVGGRRGGLAGAEVRRRETPSPIVFDDFIDLAFQRVSAPRDRREGSVGPSEGRATVTRSSLVFGLGLH